MTDSSSAKDTLTLRLEGDVSLDDFAKAVSALSALLREIERDITGKKPEIEWRASWICGLRMTRQKPTMTDPLSGKQWAVIRRDVREVLAA